MRNLSRKTIFFVLACLLFGLAIGRNTWMKRGIPFVSRREQWTIGIYRSDSPFYFNKLQGWINPLFRAEDVTDVRARFVADPFLVKEGETWNLFFEVYNNDTKQGDLAVATSKNTWVWNYEKVILDEPFHLSYPYVFKSRDKYYLIPESFEANSIRLYEAERFPTRWSYVQTLIEGRDYVDNSIVYYNRRWWLFSSVTSNDTLYLHYADTLTGLWKEHPQSPIVAGDLHKSRPSGRLLVYDNRLYRFTMDVNPPVGTHQVMVYEVTQITPESYSERLAQEAPVIMASGSGWNGQAMHQLDPVQVDSTSWVASVDGFGKYWLFGWQY
ncbi:MAG TPA: hypothetical protein VFY66_07890 [Anaerolineales bacterium]|nr:hypothetical protein [Anaerolineales bacterium]